MNICRFGRISPPKVSVHQFVPSARNPRFSSSSYGTDDESLAYRHARLFKKPVSIKFRYDLLNSVSLVGVVDRTVRVLDTGPDRFGVFTMLRVKDPRNQNRSFRIFLSMWDDLARTCIAHLKPDDLIYVSGHLVSQAKNSDSTISGLDYKVNVKELNYVVPTSQGRDFQTSEVTKAKKVAWQEATERSENRLYLWQVFFANPYEWWDNRRSKKNPRQPDFKHKDTGEALWLKPDDPPWVERQLQLMDRRTAAQSHGREKGRRHSHLSEWIYDE